MTPKSLEAEVGVEREFTATASRPSDLYVVMPGSTV